MNSLAKPQPKANKWRRPQDAPKIGNSPLIYSSPELQGLGARVLWHFSSAAVWTMGVYMLAPLSTAAVWLVTLVLGYAQLIADDVYLETISQLKFYLFIVAIIGLVIALKLALNVLIENIRLKRIFRNNNKTTEAVATEATASDTSPTLSHGLRPFNVESNFKRMIAHHDDHGHLIGVEELPVNPKVDHSKN